MGTVVKLPMRDGFSRQECSRIAAVAASVGASVAWYRTACGAVWGCLECADETLGTITRQQGMVLWYPRDSHSPYLSHINLDACLARIKGICGAGDFPVSRGV